MHYRAFTGQTDIPYLKDTVIVDSRDVYIYNIYII